MKADMREIQKLETKLRLFASRALPYAAKGATNAAAFAAMREAKATISKDMILRNRYTLQSIRTEPVRNIKNPKAYMGSTVGYMELQEFGGRKPKSGKIGVPIPTGESSGEGRAVPRRRLPRAANRLKNLTLAKRGRVAKTQKQKTLFAVQDAVTTGNRVVYLDLGRRKGLFRVEVEGEGGRKNFKRGWPKGARLSMLYDLSRPTVKIPATPWLRPAVDATVRRAPELYLKELQHQARRIGLVK
jgi:hypothetical protein